jgi:hypothetical protein
MDFQRQILKGLMNPYMPSSQRSFTDDEIFIGIFKKIIV